MRLRQRRILKVLQKGWKVVGWHESAWLLLLRLLLLLLLLHEHALKYISQNAFANSQPDNRGCYSPRFGVIIAQALHYLFTMLSAWR